MRKKTVAVSYDKHMPAKIRLAYALNALHSDYKNDNVVRYGVTFAQYLAVNLEMGSAAAEALSQWFLSSAGEI